MLPPNTTQQLSGVHAKRIKINLTKNNNGKYKSPGLTFHFDYIRRINGEKGKEDRKD
jgi:hypothetical protein